MRLLSTILFTTLLTACGGGAAGTTLGTAALRGIVTEIDGNPADLAGVPVTLVDTGETIATAPDGSFRFDRIPTGTVRLAFGNRAPVLAELTDGSEDEDGNRIIRNVRDGDEVHVELSIDNGKVSTFFRTDSERSEAAAKFRSESIEAQVELETDDGGDELAAEIEGLVPGTLVDILIDDPDDALEPALLGSVVADSEGKAELELRTEDGAALPLGALTVEDLAGMIVIFRMTDGGEELARVTIPDLGAFERHDNEIDDDENGNENDGDEDGDSGDEGEANLVAQVSGLEGDVGIGSDEGGQRFKMEAEKLLTGRVVRFEIEDIDVADSFVSLGTRAADSEGEAEISTEDGLDMPFDVSEVTELVGLRVRVLDDSTDEVLLTGTVPALGTED